MQIKYCKVQYFYILSTFQDSKLLDTYIHGQQSMYLNQIRCIVIENVYKISDKAYVR